DAKGNIWITTKLKDSNIEIAIRDDGSGISKEAEPKIFDPFFTTKSIGAGTGLGLSISYGIIERHGGSIAVDSRKGKGTTFIVALPVKHYNREKSDG
ncbi:MAG: PAS domain-containing sensor histidine kinase, partial [Candidatus Marinimicrobia bacterium]|nr:PAS domain-containing sensor histidine kinase [Candidatus Neomarinimicrobiota bacterium]